jgi:uncharacterized membrane protein YfcA
VTLAGALGALVIFGAHFVFGLAGFGVGLVALAFLPFLMAPTDAVVLLTLYATLFAAVLFVPLRREFTPRALGGLLAGSVLGTPAGVWVLAAAPASVLSRLIGAMLVIVVALEFAGRLPRTVRGRGWGLGAGLLSGLLGGAVGLPGPPVIVYAAARGWSPRTFKANVQAFFIVNQGVIVIGYAAAGLVTAEVVRLSAIYFLPALAGLALGMSLFHRVDPVRFRRMVFALLLVSGVALLVAG